MTSCRHEGKRQLLTMRENYEANFELQWQTDTKIPNYKAAEVAQRAKSFIIMNIPASSPNRTNGVVAIGVSSVHVLEQELVVTHVQPPVLLSMKFQVRGTAIAVNNSDLMALDFQEIVSAAIHVRNDEFLRMSQPFLISKTNSTETSNIAAPSKDTMLVAISVSIVFGIMVLLTMIRTWQRRARYSAQVEKDPPTIDLNERTSSDDSSSDPPSPILYDSN